MSLKNVLLLLPVICPALLALLWHFLKLKGKALHCAFFFTVLLGSALAAVNALIEAPGEILLEGPGLLAISLRVDEISRIYLLLIAVIWPGVALYALEYLEHDQRQARFFLFYAITQGVLCALALSGNLITFYLFYEMMTLMSLPLEIHQQSKEALRAGTKYLVYSVIGASTALLGIIVLSSLGVNGDFSTPALQLSQMGEKQGTVLAFSMVMLIGFGVKAGMFPMHGWLPTSHPAAPAPASAVLSGVITKMGVLGTLRFLYQIAGAETLRGTWVQYTLLILTLITVLLGSVMAYGQTVLKKRLAYSTVSQVSYVLFGLCTLTEAGFVGALLHIVFHSLIKNTLFMGAGAIIHKSGRIDVNDMNGLGRRMPWTYACFAVASLGLVGIPPTCGFISKWNLALGALDTSLPGAWIGPAVLLISAVLTAGYLFVFVIHGCFSAAQEPSNVNEAGWKMKAPMAAYAVLVVLLGVFSRGIIDYMTAVARALM